MFGSIGASTTDSSKTLSPARLVSHLVIFLKCTRFGLDRKAAALTDLLWGI
ncbi:protein of unknown function (plasmid) [Thiomonas sp. Bio17B3]|nr:protein of unknown function [Thiomonas sp. Sup16B3]VDY11264.1 protein of unknown function [Thiomonas sp. Bio17B3]